MTTTTLVNTNDNHRKFYTVTVDGNTVTMTWGRFGRKPAVKTVTLPNTTVAKIFANDKVYEKLYKRGYERLSL